MKFFDVSNANLYIAIAISILNGVLMCFASYKFFQMIQLSGYKLKGYFLWLKETKGKYVSRMILLSILSAFCVLTTNALFNVYGNAMFSYIGLVFYFYFAIVFIGDLYSAPKKVPLKNTTRMTRLNITMFLFVCVFSFFLIAISTEYFGFIKFGIMCFVPVFVPLIVPLVHIILIPVEKLVMHHYVVLAHKKLDRLPNLVKIGITGSFGKTSTKYILNSILSQKFKVCMSPHSFNTLPGLAKVVNNFLDESDQILIAEMGARNVGDIKILCNLINPKIGIITGVGNQHLQSFKTQQNIFNTKFELIESLPQDGTAIFNGGNDGAKKLFERCLLKNKVLVKSSAKFGASNVQYNPSGTQFDLTIGNQTWHTHTKLVGLHNVQNILLCVKTALMLGLTGEEIVCGIESLESIPHRLEVCESGGVVVLDDSYNASVEGASVALEVLSKMPGRKIVVTPGIVELGKAEREENFLFGQKIAKVADVVVIVNLVNFEAIKQGLDHAKFDEQNIYQAQTLEKAKLLLPDITKSGDSVLFINDLPDNYI